MMPTEIHRTAIQRTFAELYGVPDGSVDVVWGAGRITVRCAGKTFVREKDSRDDRFMSDDEDPVTITLADDERRLVAT
jgi:hypothetical protein